MSGVRSEAALVALLHTAAERVGHERYTAPMDALAAAGATFLRESDLGDEYGTPVALTVEQAIGYGIMLGWLAKAASEDRPLSNARREFRISGDTAVEFNDAQGRRYSIRKVGIGHPMHTIGPSGGRVSTDAEVALTLALIERASDAPFRPRVGHE